MDVERSLRGYNKCGHHKMIKIVCSLHGNKDQFIVDPVWNTKGILLPPVMKTWIKSCMIINAIPRGPVNMQDFVLKNNPTN